MVFVLDMTGFFLISFTLLFSFPFFLHDGAPLYHHRWSLEHYPVKVKVLALLALVLLSSKRHYQICGVMYTGNTIRVTLLFGNTTFFS